MGQALLGLLGVLLGGSLVMLGDHIRRTAERRHAEVLRLVEAGALLSATYNRLSGELRDAHRNGVAEADLPPLDVGRYEVATRFYMTPGAEQLAPSATRLINAGTAMREGYTTASSWTEARDEHAKALRAFEAEIRAVATRRRI